MDPRGSGGGAVRTRFGAGRGRSWKAFRHHGSYNAPVDAIIRRAGEGDTISVGANQVRFLCEQHEVEQLAATESTLAPGFGGPVRHRHARTFDVFYVLEGSVTFQVGERSETLGAGSFVLVPPGVAHTFSNRADVPARLLNLNLPAGLEQYLRDVAVAAVASDRPVQALMAEIAARYDFEPS